MFEGPFCAGHRPGEAAAIDRTMLIYAATIAIAAIVILRRPSAAAGVLLCTYGLEQWSQSQSVWFFVHGALTNAVTALLVILAIVVRFQQGRPILREMPREFGLVIALAALMVASTAWSIAPEHTLGQFRTEGVYFAVFALMMPMIVSDRRDLRDAMFTLITMGGGLVVLLLLTARWEQRSIVMATGSVFSVGGLDRGNPLSIGSFGGYVALVMLLMNFTGVGRVWQLARYAIVLAAFAVTLKSGSRGQTLAILLTAIVLLPYSRRVRNLGSFIGFGISVLILGVVGSYLFEAYTQDGRWTLANSLNDVRGARMGMAGVLLGEWVAAGPFRWIFGFGSSASWGIPGLGYYPHVVPAEVLGELGLIGFALFCAITYFAYRNARDLWPLVRDDPEARGLVACAAALLLFKWIVGWKEGSLLSAHEMLGFSAILGRVAFSLRQQAAVDAEAYAAGYAMTDEERFLEDESYLDELYDPVPAGRA